MATASCATTGGVYSRSAPTKIGGGFCATYAGVASATARVAWGGSIAARKQVDWIPPAHVPVTDGNGKMNTQWYRFFKEVADKRLGGIDAATLPEIVSTQNSVQSQVLSVQQGVQSVGSQVSAVTDVVNTQTQVSQQSNLPGSASIAKLPSYKQQQLMDNPN